MVFDAVRTCLVMLMIRSATVDDVPVSRQVICELDVYESETELVRTTERTFRVMGWQRRRVSRFDRRMGRRGCRLSEELAPDKQVLQVQEEDVVANSRAGSGKNGLADLIEDVSATAGTGTPGKVLDHSESSLRRALNLADRTASVNLARVLQLCVAEYELFPREGAK
jgi:hypothetical protein